MIGWREWWLLLALMGAGSLADGLDPTRGCNVSAYYAPANLRCCPFNTLAILLNPCRMKGKK